VVVFFQRHCDCWPCCSCDCGGDGASCARFSWSPSLLGPLAAVISGGAGAGDAGEASGLCRLVERRSVVSPAVGRCSSGVGAAGASAGGGGVTGASGAVDGVTSVATGAGAIVGGVFVAALDVVGRAAAGGAMISLETGPGARMYAVAVTASPATTIARVDSPMVFAGGKRGPGAWKTSGPSRNQAICCSSSRRSGAPVAG
jgi:hypothetical protein